MRSYEGYLQAMQALHLASKAFVRAESKQEAQIALLETLLPTLHSEMDKVPVHEPAAGQANELAEHELSSLTVVPELVFTTTAEKAKFRGDAANDKQRVHSQRFSPEEETGLPTLYIKCFGCFEIRRSNQSVVLCHNRCGQGILRYLGTQPGYRASRDMLMEVFWRNDDPSVARRKLEVAVSALRGSLNHGYACRAGSGYIICKNQIYQLNPAVTIHSDVDDFLSFWQAGLQSSGSERAAFYEQACALRSGPYLVEDMYMDWSFMRREQLNEVYLSMCHALADYYLQTGSYKNAVKWANARLNENRCDEVAYQQLMHIFIAEGRRSEAIRQYQRCKSALMEELGMPPMHETTRIFQALLAGQDLSPDKEGAYSEIEQI